MRALLNHPPGVEHDDAVRPLHGREPVRDHERRAVPHQPAEGLLHQRFRLVVERRGGLVEDEHLAVA